MGMNIYTLDNKHIGKRSAAGWYCWDCGISLCKGGDSNVHTDSPFYDKCPKCNQSKNKETLENSSVGRELGFNKSKPQRKSGVSSCSSFSWANKKDILKNKRKVIDEYGRKYTINEFYDILKECPIQFTDSIGLEFS